VAPIIDTEYVLREIADGETSTREFKSSLIYDHKKATANPGMLTHDLKSDDVTHSCLKTIAAFLATAGGVLYAGIDDTGECVGIEFDFHFLKQGSHSKDSWELHLRNLITGRFKDGDSINDYVSVAFVEIGKEKTAARISVQRRRVLSFLMRNNAFTLYRRQGPRTVEVVIEELEEFIEFRETQGGRLIR
jgi:predicted HTH transcriptional regulator